MIDKQLKNYWSHDQGGTQITFDRGVGPRSETPTHI